MTGGMVKLSIYFTLVAVAALLAVWMADTPGQLTVDWLGWRMDTTVPVALILLGTLVAALWWLLNTGHRLRKARDRFVAQRMEGRHMRGLDALGDGFAAVHAHDAKMADRCAREARALLGESTATRLLDEQSAVLTGNPEAAEAEAQKLLERPATELAARRDLAERAKQQGDWDQVAVHTAHALSRKPAPDWAQRLAVESAVARGQLDEAHGPLTDRMADRVFGAETAKAMRAAILAAQAEQALIKKRSAEAAQFAKKALDLAPGSVVPAVLQANALVAENKVKKAGQELEKAWRKNPDPRLLEAYRGLAPGEAPLDWVKRVEALTRGVEMTAQTRLALADASYGAELWGQARAYLEPLLEEQRPSLEKARACRLMARVAEADGAGPRDVAILLERALDASEAADGARTAETSAADMLVTVGLPARQDATHSDIIGTSKTLSDSTG